MGQDSRLFGTSSGFPLHTGHRELYVVERLIWFRSFNECWASSWQSVKALAGQFDPFQVCCEAVVGFT